MKIRLVENVSSYGLNGCKGQELELEDALAVELEKHGYAEFIGDAPAPETEKSDEGSDEAAATPRKKKK